MYSGLIEGLKKHYKLGPYAEETEQEALWRRQREHPEQKSGLVEHLRAASKLTGMDGWELACGACSHVNFVQSCELDGNLSHNFCERCGVTLAFSDREYAKPVKVMKPICQTLKEAKERNAYRTASAATSEEVPFWLAPTLDAERRYLHKLAGC